MRSFYILIIAIFLGCASKGINIYLPQDSKKVEKSNILVIDKRDNKNIVGYIYKDGDIIGDITFSNNLSEYIKNRLHTDKEIKIYVKNFNITYDKSKITDKNLKAYIAIELNFLKNGKKVIKILNIKEEKWIAPINSAKKIEEFAKNILDETLYKIDNILK